MSELFDDRLSAMLAFYVLAMLSIICLTVAAALYLLWPKPDPERER